MKRLYAMPGDKTVRKLPLGRPRALVFTNIVAQETREHERDLYTGIQLAWILQPGRHKWPIEWRRVARERIRDRAHGPQEARIVAGGRLRFPVF